LAGVQVIFEGIAYIKLAGESFSVNFLLPYSLKGHFIKWHLRIIYKLN